jgi:hypothetical protein
MVTCKAVSNQPAAQINALQTQRPRRQQLRHKWYWGLSVVGRRLLWAVYCRPHQSLPICNRSHRIGRMGLPQNMTTTVCV